MFASSFSVRTRAVAYPSQLKAIHRLPIHLPPSLPSAGVYKGGTSILIYNILKHYDTCDRRLWVFDSFRGLSGLLPPSMVADGRADNITEGHMDDAVSILPEVQLNFEAADSWDPAVITLVPGRLNETLPAALKLIPAAERPRVTHQTGERHWASVQAEYAARGIEAEVVPFIDDMPRRLAECDLIVCRAGAITVARFIVP